MQKYLVLKEDRKMKRLVKVFMVLALGAVICLPGMAFATTQTFSDQTLVKQSNAGWMDIVGDAHYDIHSMSVTWSGSNVVIQIHTNDNGTPEFAADYIADLAVDLNRDGVWDTGIILKADARRGTDPGNATWFWKQPGTAGQVFTLTSPSNNDWIFTNTPEFGYGGYAQYYDHSNNPVIAGTHDPQDIPVMLKDLDHYGYAYTLFDGTVTWTHPSDYLITVTLNGINADGSWNDFNLLWGSETCGNDVQFNRFVPLPPSMLLLGSGLLGLVGLRWRRKSQLS
jgi:hypothetical protein